MNINRRDALRNLALGTLAAAAAPSLLTRPAAAQAPVLKAAAPATGLEHFTLPPLPYPADALEPHIDAQTMLLHHDKHHAAYVRGLNAGLADHPDLLAKSAEELVTHLNHLPESVRTAVRNHGGGHANHTLFWSSLSPNGGRAPSGALAAAIDSTFGGFDALKDRLAKAAAGVFGSGWAWLSFAKGQLVVETTPNQESPLTAGHQPLLGLDVWEHAYYLRYQNRRADYVTALFHVIDWDMVASRYESAAPSA